jgi:hypothetical protein
MGMFSSTSRFRSAVAEPDLVGQLQRSGDGFIGQAQDVHQLVLRQAPALLEDLLAGGFENFVSCGECCLDRH